MWEYVVRPDTDVHKIKQKNKQQKLNPNKLNTEASVRTKQRCLSCALELLPFSLFPSSFFFRHFTLTVAFLPFLDVLKTFSVFFPRSKFESKANYERTREGKRFNIHVRPFSHISLFISPIFLSLLFSLFFSSFYFFLILPSDSFFFFSLPYSNLFFSFSLT